MKLRPIEITNIESGNKVKALFHKWVDNTLRVGEMVQRTDFAIVEHEDGKAERVSMDTHEIRFLDEQMDKGYPHDHPTVRQAGTIKRISNKGEAITCMLTDLHVNFAHGERTQVIETWREVIVYNGNHSTLPKPREFKETLYLPDSPKIEMTVQDEK